MLLVYTYRANGKVENSQKQIEFAAQKNDIG